MIAIMAIAKVVKHLHILVTYFIDIDVSRQISNYDCKSGYCKSGLTLTHIRCRFHWRWCFLTNLKLWLQFWLANVVEHLHILVADFIDVDVSRLISNNDCNHDYCKSS